VIALDKLSRRWAEARRVKTSVLSLTRMVLRRIAARVYPNAGSLQRAGLTARPRCEYVCVYQRTDREPLTQVCDCDGEFVMVVSCCGHETTLCAEHVLAAQDCEWAECLNCTHLFTSWQEAAAQLRKIC
jgi:hypothetical protein